MFRFITQKMHAFLDYPVALGLIVMPFVLEIGMGNAWAFALSVTAGLAALMMTLLTDHETGLLPVVPYKAHLTADAVVGAAFTAAPFVLGLSGFEAMYYLGLGATILGVVAAHKASDASQSDSNDVMAIAAK